MPTLGPRAAALWNWVQGRPTVLPTQVTFKPSQTDRGEAWAAPFEAGKHYFQVRVNELFLANSRQWYTAYDPMVSTVTEFAYAGREETVPFVLGPATIEGVKKPAAGGMLLTDTDVSGVYPYRGGPLALTVVLAQAPVKSYARTILQVVEGVAGAVGLTGAVADFTRVGGAVLDGIDAALKLNDTRPLVGHRFELNPDAGDSLGSHYRALIHAPQNSLKQPLFVREGRLVQGPSLDKATEFRDADYVLYSVVRVPERTDDTTLPFYPLFKRVQEEAAQPGEESWKRAKANMLALYQALTVSPDLTPDHAAALSDKYIAVMKKIHAGADKIGGLEGMQEPAPAADLPGPIADRLRNAVSVLDLE